MPWSFMITLGIALAVTYILKNSADEIAYLAASILLVSLVVSLVIAPWQIQVLLLVLALVSSNRLLQPSRQIIIEPEPDEKIKLSYRGVEYEPTVPVEKAKEGETIVKYRGQICKTETEETALMVQQNQALELKYRGASIPGEKST